MTAGTAGILSLITTAVIRCHDNFRDSIFIPTKADDPDQYFQKFLEDRRNVSGLDFRRVPYKLCSKLIIECLQRMKKSSKILQGKEARTVARMFGLSTREHQFFQVETTLPEPSPAPNVESLWITLNRPEYFFFSVNDDLYNFFKYDAGSTTIDQTKFKQAMQYITKDEYRRNRIYAMLEHMALWHTVGGEQQIASWLLWERAAMMNYTRDNINSAIKAMESNIIFQLMINKYFNDGTGQRSDPTFNTLGDHGRGMTNYNHYRSDLSVRGTLPPNIMCTGSIADNTAASATSITKDARNGGNNNNSAGIMKLSEDLTTTKGNCAMCGATTQKDNGGPLFQCSRCNSVAYCCKDHQVLHWKKGGHKQECAPK